MDSPSATGASQAQSRSRNKRPRTSRVSEAGSSTVAVATGPVPQPAQAWANQHNHHNQTVRAPVDTVPTHQHPPTFPSQQLERSHQVAEPDGLMNGYGAPQHSQYPDPQPTLAPATQPDASGLTNLSSLAGDHHQNHQHAQHGQQQTSQQQHHHQVHQHQQQQQQQPQPRNSASAGKPDRILFQHQYGANPSAGDPSPAVATSSPAAATGYSAPVWSAPGSGSAPPVQPPSSSAMAPHSPAAPGSSAGLAPPPDGIYRSFEDLLSSVQRIAKDQGYGIVKLRASNYRDGKPTRYDLVCDRGGVKYSSTAKKRNPSTRKVDCPWRAKAVCEVNLGHQWRFAMQEARHNHEARIPAAVPGQENTPVAQSLRSLTNKVDRMAHDLAQGFARMESSMLARMENIEKRLEALEQSGGRPAAAAAMLGGGGGVASMGGPPSMPAANMGGGSLGPNGSLANGGMQSLVDSRLSGVETRIAQMESRNLDGLPMMEDESRLSMI